jgi:regulator of sigma E protease
MDYLTHTAQTLGSFALVLGILVSIHELGHYAAARWCKVKIEAFSIGFGPALKSWTDRHGTVWKLCALPLGGYVKMHGMGGEEDQGETEAETAEEFHPHLAFTHKKVWQRAVIAAAGPAANFVLAVVLFTALQFSLGTNVPLAYVGDVRPGTAAAEAGLLKGDQILAVDGTKVDNFLDLQHIIGGEAGQVVTLSLRRDNKDITATVHVRGEGVFFKTGRLGVASNPDHAVLISRSLPEALVGGASQTWALVVATFAGLVGLITTGDGAGDLGGPIAIAHLSGQVAQLGLASLVNFIAMLSVNLGLLNLLPIPILDGGHLLFLGAEALRGRPVPARAQEYGYRLGMAIIATVFIFVSVNDLARYGAFSWMRHLTG